EWLQTCADHGYSEGRDSTRTPSPVGSSMKYGELKRPDIEKLDKTDKVVVVPLASLEQHGEHLPLLTDSLLGGEVAARVEAALPQTVLLLPTQWLGSSHHHMT